MNAAPYPLGHEASEARRLDAQAALLRDPALERLAAEAASCLEIGCGTGSNLPWLKKANPRLAYTGIDASPQAVALARRGHGASGEFQAMDGGRLAFADASFDLVFTKLVLWAVGARWTDVLRQAWRVLKPGGVIYALEPCNHLIELQPRRPAAREWMRLWDEAAAARGLDPFIGPKVPGALAQAGFHDIAARFHPVVAVGSDARAYEAVVGNLMGFYLGPAATSLGLDLASSLASEAGQELMAGGPGSLVMDALFVSVGRKPAP